MTITVATESAQNGFYPTPPELAQMLVSGINWYKVNTILEPSAGAGNLILALTKNILADSTLRHYTPNLKIDLIESDAALKGILRSKLMETSSTDLYDQYLELSKDPAREDEALDTYCKYHIAHDFSLRFVHDDFRAYETLKPYDLILMNPPFNEGAKHLLKAISMQERYGGKIHCILNAETLNNPFTNRRKWLVRKLEELNAEITFHEHAFADAERPTNVQVAIVKIDIPAPEQESEFFNRCRKAEEVRLEEHSAQDLAVTDPIQSAISRYRIEVDAGISLLKEYSALRPYILADLDSTKQYNKPIIRISINDKDSWDGEKLSDQVNKYLKSVRLKYWSALFKNKQIFGQLTTNLQQELHANVHEMAECEFDEYNINILVREMNAKMISGVRETILRLFDQFTSMYHWRAAPEVKNIHYFNGWASNKAHYINKKIIQLCPSVFDSWNEFHVYEAVDLLSDIEKVMNYLDGNLTAPVDLWDALSRAKAAGITKNIETKFFYCTFYKKGTVHITFKNQELLDRFNLYCCKEKNWLPPSYGTKKYADMDENEQAVIDSFHGDGAPGSGEAKYGVILQRANYYLAPPNCQTVGLAEHC